METPTITAHEAMHRNGLFMVENGQTGQSLTLRYVEGYICAPGLYELDVLTAGGQAVHVRVPYDLPQEDRDECWLELRDALDTLLGVHDHEGG